MCSYLRDTTLGSFNPATNVVIDASTGMMSGGAAFAGVPATNAGFPMWVFTFSSFTVQPGIEVTLTNSGSGAPGVALLSQSDVIINGVVDASASAPSASYCGPGAGTTGGTADTDDLNGQGGGGGGGGFGGTGGDAAQGYGPLPGPGGGTYSPDITARLIDGSCGGSGGGGDTPGYGGDGGGAIQIGALGAITMSGSVLDNGANGTEAGFMTCRDYSQGSGGGGSGGAILLRSTTVNINAGAMLSANGGNGGPLADLSGPPGTDCELVVSPGGGGGGGRIVIDYIVSGTNNGSITATGGTVNATGEGADGTIFFGQNAMVLPFPNMNASLPSRGILVLTWPATATNYIMQTSPTIGPDAVWQTMSSDVVGGENIVLTTKASGATAFFRLKHN